MSDLPELKPCPFCNPKKIRDFRYVVQVTQGDKYGVACINHTCKASPVVLADTQEVANEIWNTRADLHEALKAENEKLREAVTQAHKIIDAQRKAIQMYDKGKYELYRMVGDAAIERLPMGGGSLDRAARRWLNQKHAETISKCGG